MKLSGIYPDREIQSIGRLLTEFLTGLTWTQIRLNQAKQFTIDEEIRIGSMLDRMIKHEPIQYILGETEFFGMKLIVRPGVLIPRGETEELVDWVIKSCGQGSGPRPRGNDRRQRDNDSGRGLKILDIGCGSGAIAIALAKKLPDSDVVAADISEEALQVTRENAALNGLDSATQNYGSLRTFHLDILEKEGFPVIPVKVDDNIPQRGIIPAEAGTPSPTAKSPGYDIIVSNPPYVPLSEKISMMAHVTEYEPETALFVPDEDPLLFYRAIAEFAFSHLDPGGQVFVEIHDRLGEETASVFRNFFSFVELRKDIHGKDRMIRAYHG